MPMKKGGSYNPLHKRKKGILTILPSNIATLWTRLQRRCRRTHTAHNNIDWFRHPSIQGVHPSPNTSQQKI
ncbi:unnamed protein product, partial [Ectocarpus sp. 8 AP-2014]